MVVRDPVVGDHDAGRHALPVRAVGREIIPATSNGSSNGEADLLLGRNVRHALMHALTS